MFAPGGDRRDTDLRSGTEQATFTLPNGRQVFGTRNALGPAFGYGNSFTANISNSNYNSLQISVERKASDITFLAAYTYGKALDNSSGFNDWVNFSNYRLSRALSSFDVRHNFVASYNWALPFGRVFSNAPKRLMNGWNLVGITRATTGFPISLSEGGQDISLVGSSNIDVPNRVGPVQTQDPRTMLVRMARTRTSCRVLSRSNRSVRSAIPAGDSSMAPGSLTRISR